MLCVPSGQKRILVELVLKFSRTCHIMKQLEVNTLKVLDVLTLGIRQSRTLKDISAHSGFRGETFAKGEKVTHCVYVRS